MIRRNHQISNLSIMFAASIDEATVSKTPPGFSGATVKTIASRAVGPGSTPVVGTFRDLFIEPIRSVVAEWTLNCVCVPMSGSLLVRHW
jgi:hypothetical protein